MTYNVFSGTLNRAQSTKPVCPFHSSTVRWL